MRKQIINRILGIITSQNVKFHQRRWFTVAFRYHNLAGKKFEVKNCESFILDEEKLNDLSDENLLELYELIVCRMCVQM